MTTKRNLSDVAITRNEILIYKDKVPTEAIDGIILYLKRHPHIDGETLIRIYVHNWNAGYDLNVIENTR
jgi:hypothetical protein